MEFRESGWIFKFSDGWIVKKYDDHRYYRWLSGQGFKGVDFLAFRPNDKLLCIEVKNYRQELPPVDTIANIFCKKVKDTLRIVNIIEQYYLRKPLYRLGQKTIRRWPQFFGEWGYWTEIAEIMHTKEHCIFVLWIKAREADPTFYDRLKQQIQSGFAPEYRFYVLPHDGQQSSLGLEVVPES